MKNSTISFNARQEMHNASFEVFHYKDARFSEVPIHSHDFYEIYLFVSGEVDYRIESNVYVLKPGNLLIIPPSVFHQPLVSATKPYERIVLWINRDYLHLIAQENPVLLQCFSDNRYVLETVDRKDDFYSMLNSLMSNTEKKDEFDQIYARSLLSLLLASINRIARFSSANVIIKDDNPTIPKILSYINDNFTNKVSLESVADYFYLNKYYLSHLFSAKVGVSIYKYIISKRLSYARELLENGFSPYEACEKSGFSDYTNFYKAYKGEYGFTPKQHYNRDA